MDEFSIQNNLSLFSFSSKQLKFLGQNKIINSIQIQKQQTIKTVEKTTTIKTKEQ